MTIFKTIEHPELGDISGPDLYGPDRRPVDGRPSDESVRVVEETWEAKSTTKWVRDDRGPLKAVRWRAWDRFGVGHPPSRVVKKGDA